tara:strand:- start:1180 stop:1335 length:156 start_codon:yes stop_codon:yes gene_type:complete
MDASDLKLYTINASSFLMSMTNIETTLKIILLVASIGYTLHRWYFLNKEKK